MILKRGDHGFPVAVAQARLIAAGFSLGALPPYDGVQPGWYETPFPKGADGVFGEITENAVKSFQTGAGLQVTGTIDAFTFEMLDA